MPGSVKSNARLDVFDKQSQNRNFKTQTRFQYNGPLHIHVLFLQKYPYIGCA